MHALVRKVLLKTIPIAIRLLSWQPRVQLIVWLARCRDRLDRGRGRYTRPVRGRYHRG